MDFFVAATKAKNRNVVKRKNDGDKNSVEYEYNVMDQNVESGEGKDYIEKISDFFISTGTLPKSTTDGPKNEGQGNENVTNYKNLDSTWSQEEDTTDNSGNEKEEEDITDDVQQEYICSGISNRLLDESDIENLKQNFNVALPDGQHVIQMAINELYARYGYKF